MSRHGFTLIELSIVLVVIGLIIGGVLVGQDLIRAAEVRATISQIEKYNTAVNTFRGKYNALPGDLNAQVASQFGFTTRGTYEGQGDGNWLIEGVRNNAPANNGGRYETAGETVMFWVDLTTANGLNLNLIDGSFSIASPTTRAGANVTGTVLDALFPAAKLGHGNYIYVYNGTDTNNYYGLSRITQILAGSNVVSAAGITARQAYDIDKKLDDGLPQTGNVTAMYVLSSGNTLIGASDTSATAGDTTTCYDNGNASGATQQYSLEINGGAGVNCVLSFKFQ